MARTTEQGVRAVLAGLLGSYNDDDGTETAPKFHVENQLNAMFERTASFDLLASTNGLINTTLTHVFEARWPIEIMEVNYLPDAALVVNATNYQQVRLLKGSGSAAAATVAASSNSATGSNMAAGTPHALTLSGTAANLKLAAGETLGMDTLGRGTDEATAVPQGRLVVHYRLQ